MEISALIREHIDDYDLQTIFREIDKKEISKRKLKEIQSRKIEQIYENLNKEKKDLVNQIIDLCIPDKKKDSFCGQRFTYLLEIHNTTVQKLANSITAYTFFTEEQATYAQCYKELSYVKPVLEKLQTQYDTQEDNMVLELACSYLCVDADVVLKGRGHKYSIDYEKLKEIVDNRYKDVDEFLKDHEEDGCDYEMLNYMKSNEKLKKQYNDFINHSAQEFAKIASNQLYCDVNDILIEEPCVIPVDGFRMRYMQLPKKKTKEIRAIIEKINNLNK